MSRNFRPGSHYLKPCSHGAWLDKSRLKQCSHSYGFVGTSTDFFKTMDFWNFGRIFFKRDNFYRFYSLILLFCKLCECDAIRCELCEDKYQKNLVSILLLQSIDSIDTFSIQNDG